MELIDNFLEYYKERMTLYKEVKRKASFKIIETLKDSGILAITSSRVKKLDSLAEKTQNRNKENPYTSIAGIERDITDIVGVRIALYFPNDSKKVDVILKELFTIDKIKEFPAAQREHAHYKRKFPGYCAKHYKVYFKNDEKGISNEEKQIIIEIQVASLMMHAWAEVEHDLRYKEKKGIVSYDEYESLDEINGLVLTAELSLQRLQRVTELRIKSETKTFINHYELATYIYNKFENDKKNLELPMGSVETLFKLLKSINRLTIKKVENDLNNVDLTDNTPIARQIMDYHTDKNLQKTQLIIETKLQKTSNERKHVTKNSIIGAFLMKWVELEKYINILLNVGNFYHTPKSIYNLLIEKNVLSKESLRKYREVRNVRDHLLHGIEIPDNTYLKECMNTIDEIFDEIKK